MTLLFISSSSTSKLLIEMAELQLSFDARNSETFTAPTNSESRATHACRVPFNQISFHFPPRSRRDKILGKEGC